jgi:hypothetical protein
MSERFAEHSIAAPTAATAKPASTTTCTTSESATPPALDRRSLRWFECPACTTHPEGQPPSPLNPGLQLHGRRRSIPTPQEPLERAEQEVSRAAGRVDQSEPLEWPASDSGPMFGQGRVGSGFAIWMFVGPNCSRAWFR